MSIATEEIKFYAFNIDRIEFVKNEELAKDGPKDEIRVIYKDGSVETICKGLPAAINLKNCPDFDLRRAAKFDAERMAKNLVNQFPGMTIALEGRAIYSVGFTEDSFLIQFSDNSVIDIAIVK